MLTDFLSTSFRRSSHQSKLKPVRLKNCPQWKMHKKHIIARNCNFTAGRGPKRKKNQCHGWFHKTDFVNKFKGMPGDTICNSVTWFTQLSQYRGIPLVPFTVLFHKKLIQNFFSVIKLISTAHVDWFSVLPSRWITWGWRLWATVQFKMLILNYF